MPGTRSIPEVTCPDCLKPENAADFYLGYYAAKDDMKRLLAKVDESQRAAVIAAYLMETIDDRD